MYGVILVNSPSLVVPSRDAKMYFSGSIKSKYYFSREWSLCGHHSKMMKSSLLGDFSSRAISLPSLSCDSNVREKTRMDRSVIASARLSNEMNPNLSHAKSANLWKTWVLDWVPSEWGSPIPTECEKSKIAKCRSHIHPEKYSNAALIIGIIFAAIASHGFAPRAALAAPNLTVSSANFSRTTNQTDASKSPDSEQAKSLEVRTKRFEKEVFALTQKLRSEQARTLLDFASRRQKLTTELLPIEIQIDAIELEFAGAKQKSEEFKFMNDGRSDPAIEDNFQKVGSQLASLYEMRDELRKKLDEEDTSTSQKVFISLPEEYARKEEELKRKFNLIESQSNPNQIKLESELLESAFIDSRVKKILSELSQRNKMSVESDSFSVSRALAFSLGVNINIDLSQEMGNVIGKGNEEEWIGWLKWAFDKREENKRELLDNPELAIQYVKKKQSEILRSRDIVLSQCYFNTKEKRWEIPYESVLQAIDHNLVSNARFRYDKRALWLNLKGDSRHFFSNLSLFNALTQQTRGVETLLLKLKLQNVPSSIEMMWIPLRELDSTFLLLLPFRFSQIVFQNISVNPRFQQIWTQYKGLFNDVTEEIFLRFIYPSIPNGIRVLCQLEYPSSGEETPTLLRNLNWLNEAQTRFENKKLASAWPWFISLPPRAFLSYYPPWLILTYVFPLLVAIFFTIPRPEDDFAHRNRLDNVIQVIARQVIDEMKLRPVEVAGGYLFRGRNAVRRAFDNAQRIRRPKTPLKSFPGIQPLLKDINEIIIFLKNPKYFLDLGARPPRGVMIHGSVQKGTKELGQAIAAEAQVPIIEFESIDFAAKDFVGQGAATVRDVFKQAREMAPVIICVNDFERVAPVRGTIHSAAKQEVESMINQFLVELDGFESQAGVVLMALTENPDTIDPALKRPGRMDRVLVLPEPTLKDRELLLRKYANIYMDSRFVPLIDWEMVAEKTSHLSTEDLEIVPQNFERAAVTRRISDKDELSIVVRWLEVYNAIIPYSLRRTKFFQNFEGKLVDFLGLNIDEEDIKNVYERMDYTSISHPMVELYSPQYPWTRQFKYPHAVWAAGRGLLAALIPNFVIVENIWLSKCNWNGIGFTKFSKQKSAEIETRSTYEKHLVMLFGSHISSRLCLEWGQANSLATKDLKQAEKLATKMVLVYGWSPKNSAMIYSTPTSDRTLVLGDDYSNELSKDAAHLYALACEKAANILKKNKHVLDELVEILVDNDGIDNKSLQALLDKHNAKPEDEPFELVKPFYLDNAIPVVSEDTKNAATATI